MTPRMGFLVLCATTLLVAWVLAVANRHQGTRGLVLAAAPIGLLVLYLGIRRGLTAVEPVISTTGLVVTLGSALLASSALVRRFSTRGLLVQAVVGGVGGLLVLITLYVGLFVLFALGT